MTWTGVQASTEMTSSSRRPACLLSTPSSNTERERWAKFQSVTVVLINQLRAKTMHWGGEIWWELGHIASFQAKNVINLLLKHVKVWIFVLNLLNIMQWQIVSSAKCAFAEFSLLGLSDFWRVDGKKVVRPKKKIVMLPSPDQNLKICRFFFFFFFFFTYRARVVFSNIFFKVSKWGKLRRNAVKTHVYKCFFKPLNTNFSKFFAQIWHEKKKKKKILTLFFRILRSVGRGQHNKKKFGLMGPVGQMENLVKYDWFALLYLV